MSLWQPKHRLSTRLLGVPAALLAASHLMAAGGVLTLSVNEESNDQPTITRMELRRVSAPDKLMTVRRTVPAGFGVVLDRQLELSLSDAAYQFRMIRGPEYRIISGTFTLEKTSLDQHNVQLPRMVDMLEKGWTSGDCCAPASKYSVPLRMASEDLHLAAVLGSVEARPIPGRDRTEPPENDPSWVREDTTHLDGLVFYGLDSETSIDDDRLPVEALVEATKDSSVRVAVENPFAWPLPVWLASEKVDGFFLLGDWLRLDREITRVTNGRGPVGPSVGGNQTVGRWAERVYWNMLEAGLRIPPLAGSGDQGRTTPIGYNRLYVADPLDSYQQDAGVEAIRVTTPERWWRAAWFGQSVVTNGPLLRPQLGGKIPGHVFQAAKGEVLKLTPELTLTVRDPVEYLEVIHNGRVHYSARLDEFAKAGGQIPPVIVKESSWVTIRVVTGFEGHFRAAMSAPWYIDFDSQPRVTSEAVEFFQSWLQDYEQRLMKLPPDQLSRHVPFVKAARGFWNRQAELALP